MLFRLLLTLVYGVIGLLLGFPISYFFQSDIYNEMTWSDYLSGGMSSVFLGAQFGSLDVYHHTVIASVIGIIIIGRSIEYIMLKKRH